MKKATFLIAALLLFAASYAQPGGTSTATTKTVEKQYQLSDTVRVELVLFQPDGSIKWVVGHEVQSGFAVQVPNPNYDPKKTGKDAQPQTLWRWAEPEGDRPNPIVAGYLDGTKKPLGKNVGAIPLSRLINR